MSVAGGQWPEDGLPCSGFVAREELQAKLRAKAEERAKRKPPHPPPRYDDVFFEGVDWLDKS